MAISVEDRVVELEEISARTKSVISFKLDAFSKKHKDDLDESGAGVYLSDAFDELLLCDEVFRGHTLESDNQFRLKLEKIGDFAEYERAIRAKRIDGAHVSFGSWSDAFSPGWPIMGMPTESEPGLTNQCMYIDSLWFHFLGLFRSNSFIVTGIPRGSNERAQLDKDFWEAENGFVSPQANDLWTGHWRRRNEHVDRLFNSLKIHAVMSSSPYPDLNIVSPDRIRELISIRNRAFDAVDNWIAPLENAHAVTPRKGPVSLESAFKDLLKKDSYVENNRINYIETAHNLNAFDLEMIYREAVTIEFRQQKFARETDWYKFNLIPKAPEPLNVSCPGIDDVEEYLDSLIAAFFILLEEGRLSATGIRSDVAARLEITKESWPKAKNILANPMRNKLIFDMGKFTEEYGAIEVAMPKKSESKNEIEQQDSSHLDGMRMSLEDDEKHVEPDNDGHKPARKSPVDRKTTKRKNSIPWDDAFENYLVFIGFEGHPENREVFRANFRKCLERIGYGATRLSELNDDQINKWFRENYPTYWVWLDGEQRKP